MGTQSPFEGKYMSEIHETDSFDDGKRSSVAEQTADFKPGHATSEYRRGRILPTNGILVVSMLSLLICIGLQLTGDFWDIAIANLLTLLFAFIAFITPVIWFTVGSGFRFNIRVIPLGTFLVVSGVGIACFQIDGVTGQLLPQLSLRWAPAPDELLDELTGEGSTIELDDKSSHSFHQFLGPNRDATIRGLKLSRNWEDNPPKQLWRQEIGAGWSTFSAVGGYAVTMEQRGKKELVTCYEIVTGTLKWWHEIEARHESQFGGVGPRGTPTIDQGRVYALGATGVLRCLDMTNGKEIWRKDLLKEFNIPPELANEEVRWGRSASPLIVDDLVIVPPGGPPKGPYVSLVAYNKNTGEEVWRGGTEQISFSSPNVATIGGVRQVLIVNENSVTGHRLDGGENDGEVLWKFIWPGDNNTKTTVSQAVALPGDRVLASKHYGEGGGLYQIHRNEKGDFTVEELWHKESVLKTKFSNVVVHNGYVYAMSGEILECVELETGKRQWKKGRYGHGQILLVDDVILVLGEWGELALVEANPNELREFARIQALEGQTWSNICLYGRHLLVRNATEAACYLLPVGDSTEPSVVNPPAKRTNVFVIVAAAILIALAGLCVVNIRRARDTDQS
jgi:outer membrane protein assembly factor BamB